MREIIPKGRARAMVVGGLLLHCLVACGGTGGKDASSGATRVSSLNTTSTTASDFGIETSAPPVTIEKSTTVESPTTVSKTVDLYEGVNPSTTPIGSATDEWVDTPDGRRRHYRLYVPSTIRAGQAVPLVVALHGGLGSSEQFAANSGFDELAESNGFIVVYPDGVRAVPDRPGLQTWNGGYCCGPAARKNVDDVGFIRFLIDLVEERFSIDPNRVFATGHSNGAIMAYRLACELADRIVAIGVQAGSLGVDDCRPSEPVSVLHLHGLADSNHPIDGGVGTGVSGVAFRSGREAVTTLAGVNSCDESPIVEAVPANGEVEISTWAGCRGGTEVRLVTVEGASHAWMGHSGANPRAAALVGEPYMNLDASRLMWSFLSAHPRV